MHACMHTNYNTYDFLFQILSIFERGRDIYFKLAVREQHELYYVRYELGKVTESANTFL